MFEVCVTRVFEDRGGDCSKDQSILLKNLGTAESGSAAECPSSTHEVWVQSLIVANRTVILDWRDGSAIQCACCAFRVSRLAGLIFLYRGAMVKGRP